MTAEDLADDLESDPCLEAGPTAAPAEDQPEEEIVRLAKELFGGRVIQGASGAGKDTVSEHLLGRVGDVRIGCSDPFEMAVAASGEATFEDVCYTKLPNARPRLQEISGASARPPTSTSGRTCS
jgi:hypothetical protein